MKILFLSLAIFSASATTWALEGVYPLQGVNPELPHEELKPLENLVGNFRVLGIGESAHASLGYHNARWRLSRYYIEKMGVREILLEANVLDIQEMTDFLLTGKGDFTKALKNLGWAYADKGFGAFLSWIYRFNQTHTKDPVILRGIDTWDTPWNVRDHSFRYFLPFVKDTRAFAQIKNHCFGTVVNSWEEFEKTDQYKNWMRDKKMNETDFRECASGIQHLSWFHRAHRNFLIHKTSNENYIRAGMVLRSLEQWRIFAHYIERDFTKTESGRDHKQAMNVIDTLWLDGASRRALLLMHNLHISKEQSKVFPAPGQSFDWVNIHSVGEILNSWLAAGEYKSIALTGYQVANAQAKFPPPMAKTSLDLKLSTEKMDFALVDPKASWITAQPLWFMHLEDLLNGLPLIPSRNYDAILYLKNSPAADPLPAPGIPRLPPLPF